MVVFDIEEPTESGHEDCEKPALYWPPQLLVESDEHQGRLIVALREIARSGLPVVALHISSRSRVAVSFKDGAMPEHHWTSNGIFVN